MKKIKIIDIAPYQIWKALEKLDKKKLTLNTKLGVKNEN